MKKILQATCATIAILVASGLPAVASADTGDHWSSRVVSPSALPQDMLEHFFRGELKDVVLECPVGSRLPLHISSRGAEQAALEFLDQAPLYVTTRRPCYLRCVCPEHFLLSSDLREWRHFSAFFTGEVE